MSFSVELGLGLALMTASGSVAGFLYRFRGVREPPAVDLRRPLHSSVQLAFMGVPAGVCNDSRSCEPNPALRCAAATNGSPVPCSCRLEERGKG
ncbi:MAG TPA: hypothetical protein VIK30_03445 [Polyangia bacterium]|jgi:hypothetical protein